MPTSRHDPALIARLRATLAEAGVVPAALRDASADADLFREGLLDSIIMPRVVSVLEQAFAVEIPLAEFERWNFASLDAMAALVARRQAAARR